MARRAAPRMAADMPRPTRAEATDVANLVLDGADGILLGSETFRGKFAVDTVRTVLAICKQVRYGRRMHATPCPLHVMPCWWSGSQAAYAAICMAMHHHAPSSWAKRAALIQRAGYRCAMCGGRARCRHYPSAAPQVLPLLDMCLCPRGELHGQFGACVS